MTRATVTHYGYGVTLLNGVITADATTLSHSAEQLQTAERDGDDLSLAWARVGHGIMLARMDDVNHAAALGLLEKGRQQACEHGDLITVTLADIQIAECKAHSGDIDGAIEIAGATVGHLFDCGEMIFRGSASTVLAETLLRRGTARDVQEAQAAIERLAAHPSEIGFVLDELPRLRVHALLAQARDDEACYRDYRDRYRAMAAELDFGGHIALATAMP